MLTQINYKSEKSVIQRDMQFDFDFQQEIIPLLKQFDLGEQSFPSSFCLEMIHFYKFAFFPENLPTF